MSSRRRKSRAAAPPLVRRGVLLAALVGVVALAFGAALWLLRKPARPNLLLITIDTLRADHLGSYGYAATSTPNLDALALRGTRFAAAETAVPLTGPAHCTILTGLYPPSHGVRDNVTFVLDASHKTLATRLKSVGYRTGGFVGAYPVASSLGFSQGFDEFEEGFHEIPVPGEGAERPANEVADSVIRFLTKAPEPFFVWMHVYDPHSPYRPPPPYREAFREHPYDGEIAFVDAQLGRVFDALKASSRDRRTLVAALGDHGESLGEHGEATHAVFVYESTLRIPLLLAGPGVSAGRVVAERVGTVDVLPTLLGLLGLEVPPGLHGRDLRPAIEGRALKEAPRYAESLFGRLNCRWATLRSWTDGNYKLIQGAQTELYDLSRDLKEADDLAGREPERAKRMLDALHAAVEQMAPGGDRARTRAVAPEQLERLRSLGYTGGGTGGAGALDDPSLPDPRPRVAIYETLQGLLGTPPGAAAKAADSAAEIARADPGNPLAFFVLGSLAYHAGEFERADGALGQSLSLDPDRVSIRAYHGALLRDMERYSDSEKELRIAVEQTSADDLRTRINLAETLTAVGKYPEAGKILADVLAQAPQHVEALGAQGRLLIAQGKPREAIPYLQQATSTDDVDAWIELANAELGVRDLGPARESAARALKLNPGHPFALAVLGHAIVLEGRRDEGRGVLLQAVRSGPRRARVWRSLAEAFSDAGDAAMAAKCRQAVSARG